MESRAIDEMIIAWKDHSVLSMGTKLKPKTNICIEYLVCEGLPCEVRNDTQYRPMLWPLTQASPFPIEPRFNATGSFPGGSSNIVFQSTMKTRLVLDWMYDMKCVCLVKTNTIHLVAQIEPGIVGKNKTRKQ